MTKIFKLNTKKGFKDAEKYKLSLENKGSRVKTSVIGIDKVKIEEE